MQTFRLPQSVNLDLVQALEDIEGQVLLIADCPRPPGRQEMLDLERATRIVMARERTKLLVVVCTEPPEGRVGTFSEGSRIPVLIIGRQGEQSDHRRWFEEAIVAYSGALGRAPKALPVDLDRLFASAATWDVLQAAALVFVRDPLPPGLGVGLGQFVARLGANELSDLHSAWQPLTRTNNLGAWDQDLLGEVLAVAILTGVQGAEAWEHLLATIPALASSGRQASEVIARQFSPLLEGLRGGGPNLRLESLLGLILTNKPKILTSALSIAALEDEALLAVDRSCVWWPDLHESLSLKIRELRGRSLERLLVSMSKSPASLSRFDEAVGYSVESDSELSVDSDLLASVDGEAFPATRAALLERRLQGADLSGPADLMNDSTAGAASALWLELAEKQGLNGDDEAALRAAMRAAEYMLGHSIPTGQAVLTYRVVALASLKSDLKSAEAYANEAARLLGEYSAQSQSLDWTSQYLTAKVHDCLSRVAAANKDVERALRHASLAVTAAPEAQSATDPLATRERLHALQHYTQLLLSEGRLEEARDPAAEAVRVAEALYVMAPSGSACKDWARAATALSESWGHAGENPATRPLTDVVTALEQQRNREIRWSEVGVEAEAALGIVLDRSLRPAEGRRHLVSAVGKAHAHRQKNPVLAEVEAVACMNLAASYAKEQLCDVADEMHVQGRAALVWLYGENAIQRRDITELTERAAVTLADILVNEAGCMAIREQMELATAGFSGGLSMYEALAEEYGFATVVERYMFTVHNLSLSHAGQLGGQDFALELLVRASESVAARPVVGWAHFQALLLPILPMILEELTTVAETTRVALGRLAVALDRFPPTPDVVAVQAGVRLLLANHPGGVP